MKKLILSLILSLATGLFFCSCANQGTPTRADNGGTGAGSVANGNELGSNGVSKAPGGH